MKKLLFSAAALLVALAAGAQNKAIGSLASKYTDVEGFTVVNLEGDALKSMIGMVSSGNNGSSTIDLGDGQKFDIGELVKDIASVTVIVVEKTDELLDKEISRAISTVKYSPLLSVNNDGSRIKVLSADIKRGKLRDNKEIVLTVTENDEVVLVRIVGKIDSELLANLATQMQKKKS